MGMVGPCLFCGLVGHLIGSRDQFQLVSYSDTQQLAPLSEQYYYDQPLHFDHDFKLNRLSLWTAGNDQSLASFSIYIALIDSNGITVWEDNLSSDILRDDPLNPWTLISCHDVEIPKGDYHLTIHGNATSDTVGIYVGPQYEPVVEKMMINGLTSELVMNIKVIG